MDISNWIERWADFAPDKVAIRFEGRDLTYRALRDRIRATARMLAGEMGIGRGDRVAFLGFNSPEMLALLFACGRLGAILLPLNWRLAPPEHAFILNHSAAAVAFVEPEFAAAAEKIKGEIGACRIVPMAGENGFEALLARSKGPEPDPVGAADDTVLLVYTSGTTGRPKGAMLSQSALTFNAVNSTAAHDLTSADVVITNLPMFHVGGLNIHTTPALHAGATVVLQRRFEPDATVAAIGRERPSLLILVPAQMQALLDHPAWPSLDLSCLRCIDTGSTTVPAPLLRAYLDRGVPVTQIYGSTETAPIVIHQRAPDARRTAGSIGKPALHCAAKICDPDGRELPPGEKGEIVVRGPNIMSGYWRDPEATAAVLEDGWFWTGDAGHTDAEGNFYVDDRIKDVIISGSENIYPAEVELVLDECRDIAESAVVARPDARWGEVPVACVVRRPGSALTREEVLALYPGRLARFKHPHDVVFLDRLPRNVMGKVLKYELRAMLAGER
jgi:fatty-acyl-CoA synthase